jgi:hypothetical protein
MSSKEESEARVLSYHDVLLRRADLDLLKGPEWLNDQVGSCTAWTQLLSCAGQHAGKQSACTVSKHHILTDVGTPLMRAVDTLLLHVHPGGAASRPVRQSVLDASWHHLPTAKLR